MCSVVIFGGTTEGRKLCEFCAGNNITATYCAATIDGARVIKPSQGINIRIGRLNAVQMAELLNEVNPALVIDATHPYAAEASNNIAAACGNADIQLISVSRDDSTDCDIDGCMFFDNQDSLLAWLNSVTGTIFATTGVSFGKALTLIPDYKNRVWMRILPSLESLKACLDLGYSPKRLICMQGPFTEDLNIAMFKNASAKILVTKDGGIAGGFPEKINAARKLGMKIAVIVKPKQAEGISLREAEKIILGLVK